MEKGTFTGLWWLPDRPDNAVAGVLSVSEGEFARLELIGVLRGLEAVSGTFSADSFAFEPEIILGLAGGTPLTLYRCTRTDQSISLPGIPSEKYIADVVFRGAHLGSIAAVRFGKMSIQYDALFEWAGLNGINVELIADAEGHAERIVARYDFPEMPEFRVDGAVIRIRPRVHTSGWAGTTHFTLTQDVVLEVEPDEPLQFEDFHTRYFHDVANFISLGVGGPIRTTSVVGTLASDVESESDRRPKEIEAFFVGRGHHVDTNHRRQNMLFTLPKIRGQAESAIQRWLQRANSLRPIYDLYFGTLFQEGAYIHQRFLSLAQALESYHRRAMDRKYVSEEAFADARGRLTQVVTGLVGIHRDVKQAWINKLTYFNEVALRRRLRDLFRACEPLASQHIGNAVVFIEHVVATRNYYTHFDPSARRQAVSEEDLPELSDQMQFLLELCLLRELGLTAATIAELVRHHKRYGRMAAAVRGSDPATT